MAASDESMIRALGDHRRATTLVCGNPPDHSLAVRRAEGARDRCAGGGARDCDGDKFRPHGQRHFLTAGADHGLEVRGLRARDCSVAPELAADQRCLSDLQQDCLKLRELELAPRHPQHVVRSAARVARAWH